MAQSCRRPLRSCSGGISCRLQRLPREESAIRARGYTCKGSRFFTSFRMTHSGCSRLFLYNTGPPGGGCLWRGSGQAGNRCGCGVSDFDFFCVFFEVPQQRKGFHDAEIAEGLDTAYFHVHVRRFNRSGKTSTILSSFACTNSPIVRLAATGSYSVWACCMLCMPSGIQSGLSDTLGAAS